MFFKVLGSPETLFQKGFWWGPGAKPLADKLQFEIGEAYASPIILAWSFLEFQEPFCKKVLGGSGAEPLALYTPRPSLYAAILATVSSLSLPMSMK